MTQPAPHNGRPPNALSAWMFSAPALAVLLLAITVQKIWGADTWWQLATGRWIVAHRAVPTTDTLSFTASGHEWIELRWLFCLALYGGWQLGGPALLITAQALVIGATWVILVWPARRALASPLAALAIALGLAAGLGRWVLRPELVTYLLAAVFLTALDRLARTSRERPPGVPRFAGWWLVPLQIVWVNAHTLFVIGPVLAWVFAAGDSAQRFVRRARGEGDLPLFSPRLLLVALAVTGACLANPYFLKGALFPLTLWRELQPGSVVASNIGELQSPLAIPLGRWTLDLYAGAALAAVGVATFLLRPRALDLARLAVFAAGVYLACKAQRNVGLFVILASWATVQNIGDAVQSRPARPAPLHAKIGSPAAHLAVALASLALAWYVATDRYWISIGAPRETGIGVVRMNTPEETVAFLAEARPPGPTFNAIRDGGYLAWARPEEPVFVDGRSEVYGERLLGELFSLRPSGWAGLAARWKLNTAIIPTDNYADLARALVEAPDWKLIHVDGRAFVFTRVTPESGALIQKYALDPTRAVQLPEAAPFGDGPEPWKHAIGAPPRPWYWTALASAAMQLGAIDNAARFLDAALARAPDHTPSIATHAAIARFRNDPRGATLFARLPPGSSWSRFSDRTLADLLIGAARRPEAAQILERLLESEPSDHPSRIDLADQYFQLGDFARAAEHYQRAMGGTTGSAANWKKLAYAWEKTGDDTSAVDAYRLSLAADPAQPDTYYLLGRCLARQRNPVGAAAAFKQALALKPEYAEARQALEAVSRAR